ncbi:MAG TPA: hypothetical protein DGA22_04630 [Acidobacterium sp.]|nr:hypothetical protein [Acidobacterium sp.]
MQKCFSQFRTAMHKFERGLSMSQSGRGRSLSAKISRPAVFLTLVFALLCVPALRAQTTASLTGAVTDPTGAVVPGAKVTLTNDATGAERDTVTDSAGDYNLQALLPGTYTIHVSENGFQAYEQHGLTLTAGADAKLPDIKLALGSATQTVTVHTNTQILPTVSGEHSVVLSSQDIHKLALGSRDLSEMLKILPGVTVSPSLSNGPSFNFTQVSAAQSAINNGLSANGAPYRGGTTQLLDGVDVNDPGCNCNAITLINPDMTQEVSVETSNFGAQSPYGPVLVSTISKSGGSHYHGEGYFYARNDVLNANDWQSNHQGLPRGNAHYYYPGGNIGGPVPGTHKKLRFWGGYERFLQNTGNTNYLRSFIPTPDMMAGNFGDTPANAAFCQGASNINSSQTNGCNDLTGTILPNGQAAGPGTSYGSTIPAQFLDAGAKALSSFWPTANANPATTPGGYNYYQVIPGTNNGWMYRLRVDYDPNPSTQFYVSYQQSYSAALASGNGAHIYWTPYASIPYPGGGLYGYSYTKAISAHLVHTFGPNLTNELIAAWGYGNFPTEPSNPNAATRSGLGYPYGTIFSTGSNVLPSYSSAGYDTFPDFSQPDYFENSSHSFENKKETPSLADNVVWQVKNHTIKLGGFAEEVSNDQGGTETLNGNFGSFSFNGTVAPNVVTGQAVGSPNNPTANFLMGIASSYNENNTSQNLNMAFGDFAAYYDDTWQATKRLSIEYGMRIEHIGHWYDKNKNGVAVFMPSLVVPDYNEGRLYPGVRWHGVDPGVPSSGMPNRFAYMTPRIGASYDIFGNGKTLIRGGWGIFRFTNQPDTNSVLTAQEVLGYNLPSGDSIFLSQVGQAGQQGGIAGQGSAPGISIPTADCSAATGCINNTVYAENPLDDQIPDSTAWNVTLDQQLPMQMMVEAAYVANHAENLPLGSEELSGSGFSAFDDVNKIPLGAFFKPDPVTGMVAKNPEQVNATCTGNTCNQYADYHPYGKEYGNNSVYVTDTAGYSNYNSLQLSLVRHGSNANFDVNYTYQSNLSTTLGEDAFSVRRNYGYASTTRRHVFNFSGSYTFQRPYKGENHWLRGAANGWTISNITTWQAGGFLQTQATPNFGLTLQYGDYNGAPISKKNPLPNGATGNSLSQATYYGTNSTVDIMPEVTCNPASGTANNQRIKYSCFTPPKVGQYGPRDYPYTMAAYFDSDMSLYKNFHVVRSQTLEFRIQAFNWLNHPLPEYSASSQLALHYTDAYGTSNFGTSASQYPNGNPNNFGVMDTKSGQPNQRTLELSVKYMF